MIRTKLIVLVLLAASVVVPASVQAQGLSISIGDRGYYTHGNNYWDHGYRMYWVPGHRYHGRWVHGHYARGERRRGGWDRRDERRDGFRADFR